MSKYKLTVKSRFWRDKTQWPTQFYAMCEGLAQVAPAYEAHPSPQHILIPDSENDAFERAFTGLPDVISVRRLS